MSSPEPVVYAFSFKLETTAKGLITPTVTIHSNDADEGRKLAVQQYLELKKDLEAGGFTVASEVKA